MRSCDRTVCVGIRFVCQLSESRAWRIAGFGARLGEFSGSSGKSKFRERSSNLRFLVLGASGPRGASAVAGGRGGGAVGYGG
ncbi:hypothetical protein M0R45_021525 [Rubus argutus]|uniref:Uncharacterized protein n=1 Tax=Rubus argutus TaxID=59490 RepID=A0AAW1XEN0_RUBAR